MKKCKMSVTGEHSWYMFPVNQRDGWYTTEMAQRCQYCQLFAGTDNVLVVKKKSVNDLVPDSMKEDW